MVSQPKAAPNDVSRKVLAVIITMLAIIIVPVTLVSQPLSKIVVIVTNGGSEHDVYGQLSVDWGERGFDEILLQPGAERTFIYSLRAGTHEVSVHYMFLDNLQYETRDFRTTVHVSVFESEQVQVHLVG